MFTSRIEARMAAHLHGVDAAARQQRGAPAPAEVLPSFEEEGEDEDDTPAWLSSAASALSSSSLLATPRPPGGASSQPPLTPAAEVELLRASLEDHRAALAKHVELALQLVHERDFVERRPVPERLLSWQVEADDSWRERVQNERRRATVCAAAAARGQRARASRAQLRAVIGAWRLGTLRAVALRARQTAARLNGGGDDGGGGGGSSGGGGGGGGGAASAEVAALRDALASADEQLAAARVELRQAHAAAAAGTEQPRAPSRAAPTPPPAEAAAEVAAAYGIVAEARGDGGGDGDGGGGGGDGGGGGGGAAAAAEQQHAMAVQLRHLAIENEYLRTRTQHLEASMAPLVEELATKRELLHHLYRTSHQARRAAAASTNPFDDPPPAADDSGWARVAEWASLGLAKFRALDGGTREREVSDAMESVLEETLARNIELQRELSRTSSARTSA